MLCHEQCKVRILRLLIGAFIAVTIYCDDTVRIFIYDDSIRIHTECPHVILKFLCPVHDLTLIQLISQV